MSRFRTLFQKILPHGLFWSWNLLFLSVVYFGLLPFILYHLFAELIDGTLPGNVALSGGFLLAVPLVSTLVGALYLRHQPARLLALFYGVEGPLFCVALFRLFILRDVTPGAGLILVLISLAILGFGYGIAFPEAPRSRLAALCRMLTASLCLTVSLYFGALLLFYAVPVAIWLLKGFFSFEWVAGIGNLFRHGSLFVVFWGFWGVLLFLYAASLFAVLPLFLVYLYGRECLRMARAVRPLIGALGIAASLLVVPALCEGLYQHLGRQTQRQALATLATPPQSDAERQDRLRRAEELRAGLLNAYLASYRYLSSTGTNDHITELYEKNAGTSRTVAQKLQGLYNLLADPFLYHGASLTADRDEAERLYEQFFDEPIQKAERETIVRTLQATWDRDGRQAGLVNIGQRRVLLRRQELTTRQAGDLAEVELHEVYENQTVEEQEIFYYFTLPESAVITGLYLGDSDDRSKRFPFVVAPRGAAQKVYNAEVRRRADPSLLEQVGPRQYRLRAFPIPARPRLTRSMELPTGPQPVMHLWLSYRSFVDPATSAIPLPALVERRNVYFSSGTERLQSGRRVSLPDSTWLPESIKAEQPAMKATRRIDFDGGLAVTATPIAESTVLPAGQSFAVVLDRSRSMGRHRAAVADALAWLRREVEPKNRVHLYLTAAPSRGESVEKREKLEGFDATGVTYYGGHGASLLLSSIAEPLRQGGYRAILVLTDEGSLDLADDKGAILDLAAPVYMVHVGGRLSAGYDDATLATIEKRGGAAVTSLGEAFFRLAEPPATGGLWFAERDAGYRFTVEQTLPSSAPPKPAPPLPRLAADDPFRAVAARKLILAESADFDPAYPERIDAAHRVAKQQGIVTAYSSMLVLVDDRQRAALKQAEEEKDRFQRTVESGKETLTSPHDLLVSGVPEPEEWALLGLGLVGIALYLRRTLPRRRLLGQPA